MKTEYRGIDYSRGWGTNKDTQTGIRYGVIPINDVLQAWADNAIPDYGEPACPKCGEILYEYRTACTDEQRWCCSECRIVYLDPFEYLSEDAEPIGWEYKGDGYEAYQNNGDTDIFIIKSPYFTYAQFCSPCAPGACYLPKPLAEPCEENRCYCFGTDWFEDGKPPYDVYEVKTGKLIYKAE